MQTMESTSKSITLTGFNNVDSHEADMDLLRQQQPELRERLSAWIRANITPARRTYPETSYGLKHRFSSDCHVYVNNDVFKAAMLLAGHRPINPLELNWSYRIKVKQCREVWPTATRITFLWPKDLDTRQQLDNLLAYWSDLFVQDCFNRHAAQQVAHYTQALELLLGQELSYPAIYPIDVRVKARIICEVNHGGVGMGHAA